jgi:glycosyltransferase involved in cell wall biosynthesis
MVRPKLIANSVRFGTNRQVGAKMGSKDAGLALLDRSPQTDSAEPKLSIVIPAFNEEARIGKSLDCLAGFLSSLPYPSELIVVDDGSASAGRTALQVALDELPSHVSWRMLRHHLNRGKGAAVRTGCLEARGTYVAFIDADLAVGPEAINELMLRLEAGADLAIGVRRQADGSDTRDDRGLLRRLAGHAFAFSARLVLLPGMSDSQCPLKAFRREAARLIFSRQVIDTWSFDAELIYIAKRLRMQITETPVTWHDVKGSHVRFGQGVRELVNLLKIRWTHRRLGQRGAQSRAQDLLTIRSS